MYNIKILSPINVVYRQVEGTRTRELDFSLGAPESYAYITRLLYLSNRTKGYNKKYCIILNPERSDVMSDSRVARTVKILTIIHYVYSSRDAFLFARGTHDP